MTAVDPKHAPYLNDVLEAQVMNQAESITHGPHEDPTKTFKAPDGSLRLINDRIMKAAQKKFKRLAYSAMYPYSYNFVTNRQVGSEDGGTPKLGKGIKDKLWHKSFKKAMKKVTKGKPANIPKRPKLKVLLKKYLGNGMSARGDGLTARGDGLTARGDSLTARGDGKEDLPSFYQADDDLISKINTTQDYESDFYKSAGSGYAKGDGAILGTAIGLAAPLVIQGISSLISFIVRKVREKKQRQRDAKAAKEAKAAEAAETKVGVPIAEPTAETATTATTAASSGKGEVPTPYQVAQAREAADRAQSKGLIGFPNPLSFPATPIPRDGLSYMRDVYGKTKGTMYTIADRLGIPPKYTIPFTEKFIRRHAKSVFGHGAAKMILRSNKQAKPFKTLSIASILKPILKASNRKLGHSLHHLKRPIRGNGVVDMLIGLAAGFLRDAGTSITEGLYKINPAQHIKAIASVIADKVRKIVPAIIKEPRRLATDITRTLRSGMSQAPPVTGADTAALFEKAFSQRPGSIEGSMAGVGSGAGYGDGDGYDDSDIRRTKALKAYGKLNIHGGGVMWDLLKNVIIYGAPILGAVAGEAIGKKHKILKHALMDVGESIGENLERQQRREKEMQYEQQERKEIASEQEAMRAKELEEYKKAREITPDQYKRLRDESDYARRLAEMMGGIELSKPRGYSQEASDIPSYKPHKWHMISSERNPSGKEREYLEDYVPKSKYHKHHYDDDDNYFSKHKHDHKYGLKKHKDKEGKELKRIKKAMASKALKAKLEQLYRSDVPISTEEVEAEEAKSKKELADSSKIERLTEKIALKTIEIERKKLKDKDTTTAEQALKKLKRKLKDLKGTEPKSGWVSAAIEAEAKRGKGKTLSLSEAIIKNPLGKVPLRKGPVRYKIVKGITRGVGPTTADALKGHGKAITIMKLSKKIKDET